MRSRLHPVAQTDSLLYRRLATCGHHMLACERPAGCQPAIQQVSNLRYRSCVFASGLMRFQLGFIFCLLLAGVLTTHAHHFKGLPHYNYFENYPQVPQEEFLGQVGEYEMSLVVYDFQGIQREDTPDPDKVRLFLLIFNLLNDHVYQGPLKLEILDRDEVVYAQQFEQAELENLYSLHRDLPDTGRYALRVTLLDGSTRTATIPFRLSSQKIHWGRWIAGGLVILIAVAAVGARRKRVALDRREAHQRARRKEVPHAAQ